LVQRESTTIILDLLPWKHKIRELQEAYDFVTMEHVYKEFNHTTDALPKEVVDLHEGLLVCKEL
jgi:hypothetical protein